MKKRASDFDPGGIIIFIESLLAELPADSRISKEVEHATTSWLLSVYGALESLSLKDEDKEKFQQAIQNWLRDSHQAEISVNQTSDIKQSKFEQKDSPEMEISSKENAFEKEETKKNRSEVKTHLHKDELLREYCWKLANCSDKKQIEEYVASHGASPYEFPEKTDIVLHGTSYTSEDFPPVWIGEAENISMFSRCVPNLGSDVQIWLSFSESFEDIPAENPRWIDKYEDTLPLWHHWHNLLYWSVMAPEATVFVNNTCEQLSQARDAVCNTLSGIYRNFEYALDNPEKNLIGENLHKVYSAFYQFLFPEDLDVSISHKHIFAILRNYARDNVTHWLHHLQIEEYHPAGPLRTEEFLGNIKKHTQKNTRISIQHPFLKGKDVRESQVLYWLRPKWSQQNPPPHQTPDLFGSVLYCFD
ncbi:MAG: hypothetical protein GY795_37145 [Desulfobacterales bacterium]|nr:hypothetical protein [Desulfobacterales bacterium]